LQQLLQALSELYGPSGCEDAVREFLRETVAGLAAEARVDALGNLIVRAKAGTAGGKRVMLAAHMDEIGIVVSHIDEEGFLRFNRVGGLYTMTLVSQRVRFASGQIGVIGLEPIQSKNEASLTKMYIDIGAGNREEAEKQVRVGDIACFERQLTMAASRVVGKAMDDRAGCAVLVEVLRALQHSPHDVYVVFTSQEEVGLRGATTSAYGIEPKLAIAVDVTSSGDTPEAEPSAVALGKGPAIKVMDGGMLAHPGVKDLLIRTAEAHQIPYQREVLKGGTTDARAIQTSRSGVPTGAVSLPTRYVHTVSEMIDLEDLSNTVRLLVAMLEGSIEL